MQDNKHWKSLEYVSLLAALEWLAKSNKPQEIIKQSIISGCINGKIKYRIIGGLPSDTLSSFLPATVSRCDFIKNGGIEINRASFERWSKKMDSVKGKQKSIDDEDIDPRTKRTYLNTIAALLTCITGDNKEDIFASETELRKFLAKQYDGYRGVTERTLADTFSAAKKSIIDRE